jgi:hypothetical protein
LRTAPGIARDDGDVDTRPVLSMRLMRVVPAQRISPNVFGPSRGPETTVAPASPFVIVARAESMKISRHQVMTTDFS